MTATREIRLAREEFDYALHIAKTGEKRGGTDNTLIWTRIRKVLSQAAEHLEEHARNRLSLDEYGNPIEENK